MSSRYDATPSVRNQSPRTRPRPLAIAPSAATSAVKLGDHPHISGLPFLRFHLETRCHTSTKCKDQETLPNAKGFRDLTSQRLRRVFGRELLELFCPFGEPLCQATSTEFPRSRCAQTSSCPYGVLFATCQRRRPPFAFHVFPPTRNFAVTELTLLGDAWRLYPWALGALNRALRRGLGKKRQQFRVDMITVLTSEGPVQVCDGDLRRIPCDLKPQELWPGAVLGNIDAPLAVDFLSPTRLLRDGRLLPVGEPVTFALLVARCLDRAEGIFGNAFRAHMPPGPRSAIEAAAAQVPLLRDETRWVKQRDYSARHRREFSLDGLSGRLTFGQPASRFLPLLRAAEVLHVGKNPAAGCGRLSVRQVVGDWSRGES